jgi:hypothetical protein
MKNFFLILLLLFILSFSVLYSQWKLIGLEGEDVKKIIPHPDDPNTIFAGSAFVGTTSIGGFFVSTDSGNTWDTLITGISVTDFVIDYQNPLIIYLAIGGSSPTGSHILKTTDGGLTWFDSSNGIFLSWEVGLYPIAIDLVNPYILYCGTLGPMGGDLYKTTNGGLNWFTPSADTSLFYIGVAVIEFDPYNTSMLYVGRAMNGKLFRSIDGGVNFEFAGYENGGGIENLKFGRNSNEMYATSSWSFAYSVGIFKTIDGGIFWENLGGNFIGWVGVFDIALDFAEQDYIYIAADAWEDTSGVYVKINENEWQLIGLSQEFVISLFINDSSLYAGTNEGIFARDLITDIDEKEFNRNEKEFEVFPSYPNPFNNVTQLKYFLGEPSNVKIEIFDILGNIVKTLFDDNHVEGGYTLIWDGKDSNNNSVVSGIYLVKFQVGKEIEVQKILLLK